MLPYIKTNLSISIFKKSFELYWNCIESIDLERIVILMMQNFPTYEHGIDIYLSLI
jgi:hypothetical protein